MWCLVPRGKGNRFYTKKFFEKTKINEREYDFLDFKTNNCLRGIFSVAILFGHFWKNNYIHSVEMNKYLANFIFSVGGAGVGIFYILSSYGIIRSYIKASGKTLGGGVLYIKKLFTRKIPLLLMFFFTANLIFVLYNIIWAGGSYTFFEFITKVTSIDVYWKGVHSVIINRYTWFVFVLIHLYVLLGLTLLIVEKIKSIPKERKTLYVAIIMAVALFAFQQIWRAVPGVGSIFVKEINCFSLGIFYGIYCKQIHAWLWKWWWYLFVVFFIVALLDLFLSERLFQTRECRYLFACIFVILIITKVNIKNALAERLGVLSFGIFFMQLLAMTIVKDHIVQPIDVRFGLYSTVLVLVLAYAFLSVKSLYKKLFDTKTKKKTV